MRRPLLISAIALTALILGGAASPAAAANPDVSHWTESFSFPIANFCGSGQTVTFAIDAHGTEFFDPGQPSVDYRQIAEGKITFTNPITEAQVIKHFAGTVSTTLLSGEPAGVHTNLNTGTGLGEMLRVDHGGVLTRDAGFAVWRDLYDGDEYLGTVLVTLVGPHPDFGSDFAIFCPTVLTGLGLS